MKNLLLLILTINVVIVADDKAEKSSSIFNRNTLQYALHKAHSTHPELLNLKFSVDASKYSYEASKGSWLPTLDLSSRLGPETNSTRYFGDDSSINGRSENENIEI